jgi:hypothetical protein
MYFIEYTLIATNLAAGFICAIPLSRYLSKVWNDPGSYFRYYAILIGVYFVEGVSLVMGMGIPVLSVPMAFVWGIAFGLWLRKCASRRAALKTAVLLSLFTSLPALSFIIISAIGLISPDGWDILSVEAGRRLGIPDFVPSPLNTILGFYIIPAVIATALKTIITTGVVFAVRGLKNRN